MTTLQQANANKWGELLQNAQKLNTPDLEKLTEEILLLRAKRQKISHLSVDETELLRRINKGLSENTQKRLQQLQAKRQDEQLTPDEHSELIAIVSHIEELDFARVRDLATLAQLRGTSVRVLMQELGI
ncbi:MAG: STAS/SEC14 domain-containing protein [Sphaerospermopsis sp. SIO1G2]|nr:STAS/SEC14 domain-containing protein [Sphaerospermopsis sp. SIO1G2]